MAITYTWDMVLKPREAGEHITEGSRGLLTWEEMKALLDMATGFPGVAIELREGAYTEEGLETIQAFSASAADVHIIHTDYGKKWRAWHGDPLPEQMAMTPWEEDDAT